MDAAVSKELVALVSAIAVGFPTLSGFIIRYLIDRWAKQKEKLEKSQYDHAVSERKLFKKDIDASIDKIDERIKKVKFDLDGIGGKLSKHKSEVRSAIADHSKKMSEATAQIRMSIKQIDIISDRIFEITKNMNINT